jgi:fatty acid desaturase
MALVQRGERIRACEGGGAASTGRARRLAMLGAGAALNLGVIAAALLTGSLVLAAAWPIAMVCFYPGINATRQLLEHRSFDAQRDVDYTRTSHGANTRMFGVGPLASTMGAAGFNRHLLHHWAPQISYTRLAELEEFLLDTPSGELFRARVTTHVRAFARLWRAS